MYILYILLYFDIYICTYFIYVLYMCRYFIYVYLHIYIFILISYSFVLQEEINNYEDSILYLKLY